MRGVRILVTIPQKEIDKIDLIVGSINEKKQWYQSKSNRQAVINALVRHGLEQKNLNIRGAGRYAWVLQD